MRVKPRRARVNPSYPQAWGTSDRNGHIGNLTDMRFQYEWRGPKKLNTRVLMHEDELDIPQRQLGAPALLGPDPVPVKNARPENYGLDEYPVSTRITQDGRVRGIMQAYGGSPVNLNVTVPGGVVDGVR